jgi:hypothetical protein
MPVAGPIMPTVIRPLLQALQASRKYMLKIKNKGENSYTSVELSPRPAAYIVPLVWERNINFSLTKL